MVLKSFLPVTKKRLPKKTILLTIAFIALFLWIITLALPEDNLQQIEPKESLYQASLVVNATLLNAFIEIKNGYDQLEISPSNNSYKSGILNFSKNNERKNIYIHEDEPFVLALKKYTLFFDTYAEKLDYKNILFLEPNENKILFSLRDENPILGNLTNTTFLKALKEAKKKENKGLVMVGEEKNQRLVLECMGVYNKNEYSGTIAIVKKITD